MIALLCIGYAIAAIACGAILFWLDRDLGIDDDVSDGLNVFLAIFWPTVVLAVALWGVAWLLGKLARRVRGKHG